VLQTLLLTITMHTRLTEITYDVHLQPGEVLTLPKDVADIVGPGHWRVCIRPADDVGRPFRDHSAFLNSYAPEDEGLYDDYSAG
jgi:hypothetical protein